MALDYDKLMATSVVDLPFSYRDTESMLYALSVGLGRDPLDAEELAYVTERSGFRQTLVGTTARSCMPNSASSCSARCRQPPIS